MGGVKLSHKLSYWKCVVYVFKCHLAHVIARNEAISTHANQIARCNYRAEIASSFLLAMTLGGWIKVSKTKTAPIYRGRSIISNNSY